MFVLKHAYFISELMHLFGSATITWAKKKINISITNRQNENRTGKCSAHNTWNEHTRSIAERTVWIQNYDDDDWSVI